MKKIYNKFLIISTIFLFVGGLYYYLSNDLNSEGSVPVAFGSSLASSDGEDVSLLVSSEEDKINSDISFLTTLVSIKKISIDNSLFSNESFNALENNVVKLEPVTPGRVNPFASIESSAVLNRNFVSSVTTNQPTQITNKTATLNGTINTVSGVVGDTYFEYGTNSQGLNSIKIIAKQSLVGTFIKSVSGLLPQTTYFFKACAKINNVLLCGDTVSFTTN